MGEGRAGGKVILLGEHAVVYGVPALAVGIGRGARAVAKRSIAPVLRLDGSATSIDDASELGLGFRALLGALGCGDFDLEVEMEIPAGCGLGASAAIAVAAARAILAESGQPEPSFDRLFEVGMAWEKVFHGNPSGVDVAAAVRGACIQFERSVGIDTVPLARPLFLALCVAGTPASTKAMVDGVARIKERRPDIFQKTLDGIASLVKNARLCLEAGDLPGLGQLMNLNQMLLSGWHLSTESIERACGIARDAGALGAKLTGAGGGGCVVALADRDPEPLLAAWAKQGFEAFPAEVSP